MTTDRSLADFIIRQINAAESVAEVNRIAKEHEALFASLGSEGRVRLESAAARRRAFLAQAPGPQ